MDAQNIEAKVKNANKEFYDLVSNSYEKIDGKRAATTEKWISGKLKRISEDGLDGNSSEKSLLDIGCGTGFIMRNANPYFKKRVGVDISHKILVPLQKQGYMVVCADTDHLPFKENSFSVVTCFAVLHHLYSYDKIIPEIYRSMKKGGIFYSDHDLDENFAKRFSLFMHVYRAICNEEKKYRKANKKITSELYHFTEIHHRGISQEKIQALLQKEFKHVYTYYHWLGLFPLLTKILLTFKIRPFQQGNAPLVSFVARK
jgi:ubiquinone/menaquinone biosynthesis C-methylase UbiE